MKSSAKIPAAILLIVLMATACNQKESETDLNSKARKEVEEIKQVGMVIKLNPEYIEEYKALHADSNPGVRDLLVKANMRNFSIFLHQLDDGNWYEFGYYEYHGEDFEADMAKLAKEDRNIEWLKICDPMQIPLEGYDGWAEMGQVYYNK
jgi:L-rhamnose mutarotase